MRIVADTNVLVSGLLWRRGAPHRIVDAAEGGRLRFVGPPALLEEFEPVLSRPKFEELLARVRLTPAEAAAFLAQLVDVVEIRGARRIRGLRDPDDALLVEAALVGRARFVVTGDKDLSDLGRFREVRFVSPATFVEVHPNLFGR